MPGRSLAEAVELRVGRREGARVAVREPLAALAADPRARLAVEVALRVRVPVADLALRRRAVRLGTAAPGTDVAARRPRHRERGLPHGGRVQVGTGALEEAEGVVEHVVGDRRVLLLGLLAGSGQ